MTEINNEMHIDLGPDTLKDRYILKATFRAHRMIENRLQKSVLELINQMRDFKLSVDEAVVVIDQGIRASGQVPPPLEKLQEKVWSYGLLNIVTPVMQYLTMLMSGGKPDTTGVEAKQGESDPSP